MKTVRIPVKKSQQQIDINNQKEYFKSYSKSKRYNKNKVKIKKTKIENKIERKRHAYKLYLKSTRWRNLRDQVFKIYGKICKYCGSFENIHVHHLTYKNLGTDKEILDLIPLCEVCHNKIHNKYY